MNRNRHSNEPMQAMAALAQSAEARAAKVEADRREFRERLRATDPALAAILAQVKQRFSDVALRRYWCPINR